MPADDNKAAARRFYQEVINAKNLDAIDELLVPDGVDHTFGSHNAEQAKEFFGMVHQAFPDLQAEVHDVIAEGELVAARVTYTGTHRGEFVGIPASGRQTTTNGVDLFRMQDGRQVEHLGWAGHVQLPAAAGRPTRPRHAGTRHARLGTLSGAAQPPVPGRGASGPAVSAPPPLPGCAPAASSPPGAAMQSAGRECVLGPLCTGDSGKQPRSEVTTEERFRRSTPV